MRKLENPAAWVEPTLRQAWANFIVARHLASAHIDGLIYGSSFPCDAVLDKLQQSLELVMKVLILEFAPSESDLVFEHSFISVDATTKKGRGIGDRMAAILTKIEIGMEIGEGDLSSSKPIRILEGLIPNPRKILGKGSIREVPSNTQYPYTEPARNRQLQVVAPCDALIRVHGARIDWYMNEIFSLFRSIGKTTNFEAYTELRPLFTEIRAF